MFPVPAAAAADGRLIAAPLILHTPPGWRADDAFFDLCRRNAELRIEQTAEGDLIIMPPAGGETGYRNAEIIAQLGNWAKRDGAGVAFDSSTGFLLPNGAKRSPDAAWVTRSRLATLTPAQKQQFLPLCPDFVAELRSPTDRLPDLQAKMAEYQANGARLGWLIDPAERTVHVYRPAVAVEILAAPGRITADPELPGFVLELQEIWEPGF
jgi:Uma2 family endonuclease